MNSTYTAIVKNDGDWWIGWIEEVPGVNAQEKTKADLLQSLREIFNEALEFNRAEARSAAESMPWANHSIPTGMKLLVKSLLRENQKAPFSTCAAVGLKSAIAFFALPV